LGGGVHLRVWARCCREVVVEIEGLEPAALHATRDRRLLLTAERAGASRSRGRIRIFRPIVIYPARVPQTEPMTGVICSICIGWVSQ
jgi:hypothetical protein